MSSVRHYAQAMTKNLRPLALTTAALLASLALAGCSTGGKPTGTAPDAAPAAEAPAKVDTQLVFGETFTYDDGVAVTVAAPAPFTPSQYAAGADLAANVIVAYTVVNGADEVLSLSALPDVTSGGTAASDIIDMEAPVELFGGTADILPGQSFTWSQAYSIADAADVTVALAPAIIAYDTAYWTH